jgi:large exoprotein involved in heme utilization and adhesion
VKASDTLHLGSGSTIATSAHSADGGNIVLNAGRIVDVQRSAVTSSVGTGAGTGGNITIGSDAVVLNHSVVQANAFGGPGGNVTINAGIFLASPDSVISASSAANVAGTIAINAAFTNISGAVAPLTEDLVSATTLLRAPCATRVARDTSRFVERGRAGLPPEPGQALGSPLELAEASTRSRPAPSPVPSFTALVLASAGCQPE